MILFNKIRQTFLAFKSPVEEKTIYHEIEEHAAHLRRIQTNEIPKKIIRLGVYLAAILPTSILIFSILDRLTRFESHEMGLVGLCLGVVVTMAVNWIHHKMMVGIPFDKLNPFFGSKIEETIRALRGTK